MKYSTVVKLILIVASLPLFGGCVQREVVYRNPPPGAAIAGDPGDPPPPQTEVITAAPGPLDVWLWVPGNWQWRGGWVWVGGHWAARPHPGAIWVHAHWVRHGHRRVWVGGYWR